MLPAHALATLARLVVGFALGAVVGVLIGLAMGRRRWAEDVLLPVVSVGNPIPGLAYAPLFVLWFGLGNVPAVLLVGVAAAFPVAVNTWTGVKAVKELWIRAAEAMGAGERQLFRKVVLPGALPWILTGLRLGLARAWRVLVAVEMLTSVSVGLGWLIFGAREFLATDVMLALAVGAALVAMIANGTLAAHVLYTLGRILVGLALAAAVGIPLGLLMGRVRAVERFALPLVSVLSPIPSLAWVPLFIIWLGLGNATAVALVVYAALFPLVLNTWTGVRAVNQLWVRAAEAMGANRRALFVKVVLPASLPYVIAGVRQAFARSWIAVVGGEMIAATTWGLGFVIFDAKEYLNTDVMLAALLVIGLLGFGIERLVFQRVEMLTVGRWGLVRTGRG